MSIIATSAKNTEKKEKGTPEIKTPTEPAERKTSKNTRFVKVEKPSKHNTDIANTPWVEPRRQRFTNIGYVGTNDTILLTTECRVETSGEKGNANLVYYTLTQRSLLSMGFLPELSKSEPTMMPEFRLDQILDTLFNIFRGQRLAVYQYETPFLDRYVKTFYSDAWKFDITPNQKNTWMITSIANYYNDLRWSAGCGVLEDVYDVYRYLRTTYARALLRALDLGWLAPEERGVPTPNDKKINGVNNDPSIVYIPPCTFSEIPRDDGIPETIRSSVATLNDAVALVEGIMQCTFINDHKSMSKPLKTNRAQAHFKHSYDVAQSISMDEPENFYTLENIGKLIEIGLHLDTVHVIPVGTEEVVDTLVESMTAWHKRTRIGRPVEEDSNPRAKMRVNQLAYDEDVASIGAGDMTDDE